MAYPFSRNERAYVVKETTYGTIPAVANGDAFRHNLMAMTNLRERFTPGYKTGSRSNFEYVKGRKSGTWSLTADLLPSGVAGTVPDIDPILEAGWGQAATIVPATSAEYTFADTIPSISLYAFMNPTGFNDRISRGSIVQEIGLEVGQNIAVVQMSGESANVLDKDYFASADATEKGGLGSFPGEPATPTYNGSPVVGFTGSATMDSNTIGDIYTATVRIRNGNALVKNNFNTFYPTGAEGDVREVLLSFTLSDSDTALQAVNLRNKAMSQTNIAVTLVLGTVAGSIMTITLGKVVLTPANINEERRNVLAFSDCLCLASSGTLKDEVKLKFT